MFLFEIIDGIIGIIVNRVGYYNRKEMDSRGWGGELYPKVR